MSGKHKDDALKAERIVEKVAIIAGNGKLPILVVQELLRKKQDFIILCFDEKNRVFFKSNLDSKYLIFLVDLKNITNIFSILKNNNINKAVCCGGITFSGIKNFDIFRLFISNFRLVKYCMKAVFSKQKGDNFLLTLVENILNKINCEVIAVQDILPDVLCTLDDEINRELAQKYQKDIEYGVKILDTLSEYDIGQSIVVYDGRVLGIEGAEGTRELIRRCGGYFSENFYTVKNNKYFRKGPVLIKKSKINQSKKLDVPTIGEQTIIDLVVNGFSGLAIEENGVFILDKDKILDFSKKKNFFVKII